jgi:hypothetical protein
MPKTEIVLGENRFRVLPLPAMRSFVLQAKIGPALAEVANVFGALKGNLADNDFSSIAPAVAGFFTRLGVEQLEEVTKALLQDATMDGKPLFSASGNPFDLYMQGRTMHTWQLLWFAIEVNYPDFFAALAAKGPVAAKAGSDLKESTISPGPAGA